MTRSIILAVDIDAGPDEIFEKLISAEGLASFWTPHVSGEPKPQATVRFGFEAAPVDLVVTVESTIKDSHTVKWACDGPWPYWQGTSIEWAVVGSAPARVIFAHRGWDEDQPESEYGSVAYTWAMVLQALKGYGESGVAAPALR